MSRFDFSYDQIPARLRAIPKYVLWHLGPVNPDTGRPKKIPIDASGKPIDCHQPQHWLSFAAALDALEKSDKADGIGLVLTQDAGVSCLDIDSASQLNGTPARVVSALGTWAETSQSGDGLHLFMLGSIPPTISTPHAQLYQGGQFIALTGRTVSGAAAEIADCTASFTVAAELLGLQPKNTRKAQSEATHDAISRPATVDDADVLRVAFSAKNGERIRALYQGTTPTGKSASEGDFELLALLRFYTDSAGGDSQLERLFRQSSRLDDRQHDWADYIPRTISAVRAKMPTGQAYNWQRTEQPRDHSPAASHKTARTFNLTDLGNAERFVSQLGDVARYVYPWKSWLIWSGKHWEKDESGASERLAKRVVRTIYHDAAREDDDDKRKALVKHGQKSESAASILNMLTLARSEAGIPVNPDELDNDPFTLNVQNGMVDLRTGELKKHRKDAYQTRLLKTPYNSSAKCPTWVSFLDKIMGGDSELIAYIQKAIGYSLTADTSEQCLFFLYGHGSNGKSTFIETLAALAGDFSLKTPTETLMQKKNGGGVPNDIARLNGVRLVTASEVDDGNRLNEALVKDLTGGDTMSARFMRAEFFDFVPVFKLWMFGNHKPIIRGTDKGIWRRIRLIPFEVTIADKDKDRDLKLKIRDELPGILAWAVQGCIEWRRSGLTPPTRISQATAEYQAEMDIVGAFIDECCVIGEIEKASAKDLYGAYKSWAQEAGEFVATQRRFGQGLTERGFQRVKRGTGGWWYGIGLNADLGTGGATGAYSSSVEV